MVRTLIDFKWMIVPWIYTDSGIIIPVSRVGACREIANLANRELGELAGKALKTPQPLQTTAVHNIAKLSIQDLSENS